MSPERVGYLQDILQRLGLNVTNNTASNTTLNEQNRKIIQELADVKFALDRAAIVAITDPKGRITHINDKFCELSQYSRSELIGQDHRIINSGYHPRQFFRTLWGTLASGAVWKGEIKNKSKDGNYYWVDTTIIPFLDESNRPYQYLAIRFDITQRKQAEEALQKALAELKQMQMQLVHSEKMSSIGQLVAGVAHEINNPINFIHGNLTHAARYVHELLHLLAMYQQNYPNPAPIIQEEIEAIELDFLQEDLQKLFNSMKSGSDRIRQIILSLRSFSRVDEAEHKAADIHEGIESTLLLLQNQIKERADHTAIEIAKDYGKIPLLDCYPGQLNQVFMSLLVNAIDAIDHRRLQQSEHIGKITIQTKLLDTNCVEIIISDNGCGMSKETSSHLFEPFYTTKPIGQGMGLGLSISYQIIVEKHGGSVSCESVLDSGTKFTIVLPIN
ncbi:MAG: ATP-binding protein [Cyanobacteria bacterium P01_G01_bin.54]